MRRAQAHALVNHASAAQVGCVAQLSPLHPQPMSAATTSPDASAERHWSPPLLTAVVSPRPPPRPTRLLTFDAPLGARGLAPAVAALPPADIHPAGTAKKEEGPVGLPPTTPRPAPLRIPSRAAGRALGRGEKRREELNVPKSAVRKLLARRRLTGKASRRLPQEGPGTDGHPEQTTKEGDRGSPLAGPGHPRRLSGRAEGRAAAGLLAHSTPQPAWVVRGELSHRGIPRSPTPFPEGRRQQPQRRCWRWG